MDIREIAAVGCIALVGVGAYRFFSNLHESEKTLTQLARTQHRVAHKQSIVEALDKRSKK